MAIVHQKSQCQTVSTTTWNITYDNPVGAHQILIVGVVGSSAAASWVASISYAGDALTKLFERRCNDVGTRPNVELWYLVGPALGSNNLQIINNVASRMACGITTYGGVDPTTPFGAHCSAAGSGVNWTVDCASEAGELMIDVAGKWHTAAHGGNVGALQTQRNQCVYNLTADRPLVLMSDEPGAALNTMSWSAGADRDWAIIVAPLKLFVDIVTRPIEYTIDAWDPEQRLIDANGHVVPRYKIKPNNWGRVVGLESTTAEVYDSNYEDPTLFYIESVTYDGETDEVSIITNRGDLPEVIMARLASGSTG